MRSHFYRTQPSVEEFIARSESSKKSMLAERFKKESEESEKLQLKELHWMHCPNCGITLNESKYKGMPIAKCSDCHGIFIDEKILQAFAGEDDTPEVTPETKPEEQNMVLNLFNLFKV